MKSDCDKSVISSQSPTYDKVHTTTMTPGVTSINETSQTHLIKRFLMVIFRCFTNNGRSPSVKYGSVFRRIGLCLFGRQTRKILALASLLTALCGYLTLMNTTIIEHMHRQMVRRPSRPDRYLTYDGRELPLCPVYPDGLRK